MGLYIQEGDKEISDLLEEGETKTVGKVNAGMKTIKACLE